jgi:hypothetical protein
MHISDNLSSGVDLDLGRLNLVLSDDLERRLRLAVVNRYGGRKGDLSEAVEQAIRDWLGKRTRSDGGVESK